MVDEWWLVMLHRGSICPLAWAVNGLFCTVSLCLSVSRHFRDCKVLLTVHESQLGWQLMWWDEKPKPGTQWWSTWKDLLVYLLGINGAADGVVSPFCCLANIEGNYDCIQGKSCTRPHALLPNDCWWMGHCTLYVHSSTRVFHWRVKPTVSPTSLIGHTATGLLKIFTIEAKPIPISNTNPNPTCQVLTCNPSKP